MHWCYSLQRIEKELLVQYMDISSMDSLSLVVEGYMGMVRGKTEELIKRLSP